jgi:hypothetical protein
MEGIAMRDLQGQLATELSREIRFRCLGGLEYAGQMTAVRLDHLDVRNDEGCIVRLPFDSIVAMEFQPEPGS